MKDIPKLTEEIKQIIENALCKPYKMSPIEKSERVYADISIRFRKIADINNKARGKKE